MNSEVLEAKLSKALETKCVKVIDTSDGCGSKFQVYIASKLFEGVPLLERHRMVNNALAEEMKVIHALSIKAWKLDQYEEKMKNL